VIHHYVLGDTGRSCNRYVVVAEVDSEAAAYALVSALVGQMPGVWLRRVNVPSALAPGEVYGMFGDLITARQDVVVRSGRPGWGADG